MIRGRFPGPLAALTLVLVASGCSRSGPPLPLSMDMLMWLTQGEIARAGRAAAAQASVASQAEEPLPAFGGGPGSVPVFLDREMVRERMTNRVELARAFEPVSHTLDGYRLLRLQAGDT